MLARHRPDGDVEGVNLSHPLYPKVTSGFDDVMTCSDVASSQREGGDSKGGNEGRSIYDSLLPWWDALEYANEASMGWQGFAACR